MIVAFPTNNQKTISSHIGLAKGFLVINTDTNEEKYIPNPIIETIKKEHINLKNRPEGHRGLGTGRIIGELLEDNNVDVFVSDEFGDGMRRNLHRLNIEPFETDEKDIQTILNHLKELPMREKNEFGFGYGRRRVGYGERFRRRDGSCQRYGRGLGRGRGYGRRG